MRMRNMGMEWLYLMILLVYSLCSCYGCLDEERIALLLLKQNMNLQKLSSWGQSNNATHENCCDWFGVVCNNSTKRVTRLSLDGVRGNITDSWDFNATLFLPFRELKTLGLASNSIGGWVVNQGFDKLSDLRNLLGIDLSDNRLNLSTLSLLSHVSSLSYIDLGENPLYAPDSFKMDVNGSSRLRELNMDSCGDIHTSDVLKSVSSFSTLQTLYFRGNGWSRSLNISREDLQNFRNLEKLFLDLTFVDNKFLEHIGVLSSLKVLSLQECRLANAKSIQGLCELKNLEELNLALNSFEGILPTCLKTLTSLRLIDISNNRFTGNIVSSPLPSLLSLELLSISNNHFEIPSSFQMFANLSNLTVLGADNNRVISEEESPNWVPEFQLEVFTLSNCSRHLLLPRFLHYQHNLKFVRLSHNNITGEFPTWLLDNNPRLEGLILQENAFSGTLKSSFCSNITVLDISNNKFQGTIPENMFSALPNLGTLDMSNNLLEGNIPSNIGYLKSLEYLDLSENNLSGEVPAELATGCSSLSFLKLSSNKFHGKIFNKPISLPPLMYLFLDNNIFEGSIPESPSSLSILDVSSNNFSGQIPASIGKASSLLALSLFGNHLEGPIPEELCGFERLQLLDLSENNLSDIIPVCLYQKGITHLRLSKNQLEGQIPRALSRSSTLMLLDLGDNNLTGKIPESLGSFSSLAVLLLNGNQLEDTIPAGLCQLSKLSILDLSHNCLFGPIPRCLDNMTLTALNKSLSIRNFPVLRTYPHWSIMPILSSIKLTRGYNVLLSPYFPYDSIFRFQLSSPEVQIDFTTKGSSYTYKGNILDYMSGIDLSSNQLSGEIPKELGSLREIRALNLSHNNLNGPIPAKFSNLQNIESLDLSFNRLNGPIPQQLTELKALSVFSVAHNNLTGETPNLKDQFGTFDESSYDGNPLLCGPPLPKKCTGTGSPTLSDDTVDDFLDMETFYIAFAVSYVAVFLGSVVALCGNPRWRST